MFKLAHKNVDINQVAHKHLPLMINITIINGNITGDNEREF